MQAQDHFVYSSWISVLGFDLCPRDIIGPIWLNRGSDRRLYKSKPPEFLLWWLNGFVVLLLIVEKTKEMVLDPKSLENTSLMEGLINRGRWLSKWQSKYFGESFDRSLESGSRVWFLCSWVSQSLNVIRSCGTVQKKLCGLNNTNIILIFYRATTGSVICYGSWQSNWEIQVSSNSDCDRNSRGNQHLQHLYRSYLEVRC